MPPSRDARSRNTYKNDRCLYMVQDIITTRPLSKKKKKKGSCPEPLCMLNFGMKQFGGEIKSSLVVARVSSRP